MAPLGGIMAPLWFSLNSKKTAARSAAKFLIPSWASIWHLHTKFQVLGHLRSGAIEVKLRSCSSKIEQKSCNLQTLTKARVFKQFQICVCGLVGKRLVYKITISNFQNFGFAKKKYFFFQKLTFFENFVFFSSFSKNQKNGNSVLEHYIVNVHTKFQADIIFGSHLITLSPSNGSMVPTHWGLAFGITTSSMSFYALPFLCGLVEKR